MDLYNVAQEENISVNNYPGAISHLTPQFNDNVVTLNNISMQ